MPQPPVGMKGFLSNISHYGDILAIPFFFALVVYFWEIQNKTLFEYLLLAFSAAGFLCDLVFTLQFYMR